MNAAPPPGSVPPTHAPRAGRESISVFFPAYNDAHTIGALVEDALAVLPALADDYEVLVVNDGSTDDTAQVLDRLARRFPERFRAVHHERNSGYGAALRTGFEQTRKELVFYTDGDGQYDAREIRRLRPLLTDDTDVVNGYKLRRADRVERRVLGAIYNRTARLLFRLPVRDVDCDFRLIRRGRVARLPLASRSGAICVELVRRLADDGCRFAEVGVTHRPRAHGSSQFFTADRVARTALDFAALWWKLVARRRLRRTPGEPQLPAWSPPTKHGEAEN